MAKNEKRKRRTFWEPDSEKRIAWLDAQNELGISLQVLIDDAIEKYGEGDVIMALLNQRDLLANPSTTKSTPTTRRFFLKTKETSPEAKAELEAKRKAEQEAKAKAELEAKRKAEQEAKAKAEQEAKAKAEQEAKAKAELEAKAMDDPVRLMLEQEEQERAKQAKEAELLALELANQVESPTTPVTNTSTGEDETYDPIAQMKADAALQRLRR